MADTIRMLQQVADWPAGVVIAVDPRRAERLIRTGYAERVVEDAPKQKRSREKDDGHGGTESRHRV